MKKIKNIILKILFVFAILILICESDLNIFTILIKSISLLYFTIYTKANFMD